MMALFAVVKAPGTNSGNFNLVPLILYGVGFKAVYA